MQTRKVLYLKRNAGHSLIGRIMTYLNAGDKGLFFIIQMIILYGVQLCYYYYYF